MRTFGRTLATLALAGAVTACGAAGPSATNPAKPSAALGSAAPSAPASAGPSASGAVRPTPVQTALPELTPVPGDTGEPSGEPAGAGGTTVIDWGTILDKVPDGFPVFPGASPTDFADGPSSGAWFADGGGVDAVAAWYRTAFEERGFSNKDLSSPLEDGSRVLDTVSDLPECRIQTTFRPVNGSTMIIVLYGAGCAGGEG